MNEDNNFDWSDWLTINNEDVEAHLKVSITDAATERLLYRFFTITNNSSSIDEDTLINYLREQVTKFIFTEQDIEEFESDGLNPFDEAILKFGNVDPISDGKYGELLLYVLTEAILKTPMVVQKLSFTYPNNQVMGADGVFLGTYKGKSALLIGESKMQQRYGICLSSAIGSIERFEKDEKYFKQELWMSRKHLRGDLKQKDLDFIFNSLKHGTTEFKENILVHPILLIYKEKEIQGINDDSVTSDELEKNLLDLINKRLEKRVDSLKKMCENLLENEEVYLDVFLIPVKNVNDFREKCYTIFHDGKSYKRD